MQEIKFEPNDVLIIFGASGFIGGNMAQHLNKFGSSVIGVDLSETKYPENFRNFFQTDLSVSNSLENVMNDIKDFCINLNFKPKVIFQYAADMGGAGYIFTGSNDANIMTNSALINLNLLNYLAHNKFYADVKIFYSSSACIYPARNQLDTDSPNLEESTAYPAEPDSEYGWEKLFSERLYSAYRKNYGIDIRIGRFHNIFGPYGTFQGGKEKAPAAICRKVINYKEDEGLEIWGDGKQTRSFLYIDDCISATLRLLNSNFYQPINIGSEEMVSINLLLEIATSFENKKVCVKYVDGPQGVRGRNSDNKLIKKALDWEPQVALSAGLRQTYFWIKSELDRNDSKP